MSLGAVAGQADEAEEPPVSYVLTVDGETVVVDPGEAITLNGTFTNPEIELKVGATRRFDARGLSFDYPANYAFQHSTQPGVTSWILQGPNCIVFVYAFEQAISPGEFGRMLASRFTSEGGPEVKRDEITRTFGPTRLKGVSVQIGAAVGQVDSTYVQEVYQPDGEGGRMLLLLQLPSADQELDPAEAEEVAQLTSSLQTTYAFAPVPEE
ncbi:MAG: hypothetical protein ACFB20_02835 [Opitutales bacterium]